MLTVIQVPLLKFITTDSIRFIQEINDDIERINRIIDISNDTIANEISAVNTLLVVCTIVVTVFGLGIGYYITYLKNRVSEMNRNVEIKDRTIRELANKIEETDEKIQSDLSGLYKRLQQEETNALLKRLVDEPRDISNLSDLLMARSLNSKSFDYLKDAFLKHRGLKEEVREYMFEKEQNLYRLLLFQHFLFQSILDDELRDEIVQDFDYAARCAFKCDIIKSTKDICDALSIDSAPFNKVDILTAYLKAINQSKFNNLIDIKNTLQDNIKNDLLVEAIDRCTSDKCYLIMFEVYAPEEESNDNNEVE